MTFFTHKSKRDRCTCHCHLVAWLSSCVIQSTEARTVSQHCSDRCTSHLLLKVSGKWRESSSLLKILYGFRSLLSITVGDVAQMVERPLSMREALGSTPSFSTFFFLSFPRVTWCPCAPVSICLSSLCNVISVLTFFLLLLLSSSCFVNQKLLTLKVTCDWLLSAGLRLTSFSKECYFSCCATCLYLIYIIHWMFDLCFRRKLLDSSILRKNRCSADKILSKFIRDESTLNDSHENKHTC